ncbi:MAG: hypothetical protein DWQ37_21195 [Planctomycetota bacterium]|nr:MAG: hypothetical protein DWQ37_21195 [Planctomycetota bacterium]
MRFFLAGIMQGSHLAAAIHHQGYRGHIKALLARHFPGAEILDPLDDHADSLSYDEQQGRAVFHHHCQLCRDVDVLLAFVPEASMGTAIEMWEAYHHGTVVIAVSPMTHNWAVKFTSHVLLADLEELEARLASGDLSKRISALLEQAG